uniref:FA complementation group G n=2 Tax=Salarias fasciatus TaxID=181472 RepID=A0A672ID34_SALFA
MLCGEVWDDRGITTKGKLSSIPMLIMDPRRLFELLQICTSIVQGAERLSDGQSSEALSSLQTASTMPAPRALVALTHLLSGFCLVHMSRPQMALQCYRKALETDSRCVCALYQSMLIYRQQGNTQAEIQALRLLHKTLTVAGATQPALADINPLSSSLFLSSQSLTTLLSVPSALSVLHSMALKCVLHGRVSEGVEHYLDLLAAFHSDDHNRMLAEAHTLPKLPDLYLEAGAALLIDQRPADCMALCNEVISMTMELLPENVVLEEPEEKNEPETGALSDDKVATLLWTAAAYFLQGHCHTHLKDWKQAVTHYTRCINLLVKVCVKQKGSQPQIPTADITGNFGTNLYTLQRLKGLSLAGRGVSFTQMDKLKEALRDLQLSLHTFPDCVGSGLWCGEVLWRLSRRQEAAACWKKTWSIRPQSLDDRVPVYLHELQIGASLDSSELRHRIQELGLA